MPTFDVRFAPASNQSTDLDDEGFVGGRASIDFNVTSDTPGIEALTVRQALQANGQLPREGSTHPTSQLAVLRSISLRQRGPIYYEGSINYRAVRRPADEGDETQFPWQQPARFAFRSLTSEVPIDEDADGNAIVNPGTMEPVDGVTRPITDFGIQISKNLLNINPIGIQQFANKVNSDQFLLFPPGTCKTGDIIADPQAFTIPETDVQPAQNVTYYSLVVPVIVRDVFGGRPPETAWYHRRKLQGFYHLDDDGKVVRALDDEMQPTSTPVLLDMDGKRLAPDADPVFVETKRHQLVAFGSLGIL